MKINPSDYPVMKAHCKTCPFKCNESGQQLDAELASNVTARTLFNSHQLCHGTNDTTRCKGSFDHNFAIYERMGFAHLVSM